MLTKDGPDPRLAKLLEQLDQERQRRIVAEQKAGLLRTQNAQLRRRLNITTGAALPKSDAAGG